MKRSATRLLKTLSRFALVIAWQAGGTGALAQDGPGGFPQKPIRLITPYTPGGSTDVIARILADGLTPLVRQPVVVEGKPGAGGTISTTFVANAEPDGYTLLLGDVGPVAIARSVYKALPADPLTALVPVICATSTNLGLMVSSGSRFKTAGELVEFARANPEKLTYSSSGIGTSIHMGTELFGLIAGIDMTHVPYKGGAPATMAVLTGEVDLGFMNMPTAIQQIQAGKIRALGVAALKPSPLAPSVPTLTSLGFTNLEISVWHAVMAPKATPQATLDYLYRRFRETLDSPRVRERAAAEGHSILTLSPAECVDFIKRESDIWAEVARKRKVTAQ